MSRTDSPPSQMMIEPVPAIPPRAANARAVAASATLFAMTSSHTPR